MRWGGPGVDSRARLVECGHLGHLFRRTGWWWLKPKGQRWQCDRCGTLTRSYDSLDMRAERPIHKHMMVAHPGVNTVPPQRTYFTGMGRR